MIWSMLLAKLTRFGLLVPLLRDYYPGPQDVQSLICRGFKPSVLPLRASSIILTSTLKLKLTAIRSKVGGSWIRRL